MTISATIIEDSVGGLSPRLTTMLVRYPRIIHSEMMTHRVFSRSAASSRAIPVAKLIENVTTQPFVPMFWGANQPGMQAGPEHDATVFVKRPMAELSAFDEDKMPEPVLGWWDAKLTREDAWLIARDQAVTAARGFADAGYHKEIVNRLLEPFSYITVLITSTYWQNFFRLRNHPKAEPHMRLLAETMQKALDESKPRLLVPGDWHLPFLNVDDWTTIRAANPYEAKESAALAVQGRVDDAIRLSVARCASTSYKTVDGHDMTLERAREVYYGLLGEDPIHASPAEHIAQADEATGKKLQKWRHQHLRGNFAPGWIQYRKTLLNEAFMEGQL